VSRGCESYGECTYALNSYHTEWTFSRNSAIGCEWKSVRYRQFNHTFNPWNFVSHFTSNSTEFKFVAVLACTVSRDSAACIATGYGLDEWEVGVRVPVGSRIFTSPCCPGRLWGPPNLLYNGYLEIFPGGKAAGAWSWPLTSN
jgi:hypothetical protein